jgi:hypothetical protein
VAEREWRPANRFVNELFELAAWFPEKIPSLRTLVLLRNLQHCPIF